MRSAVVMTTPPVMPCQLECARRSWQGAKILVVERLVVLRVVEGEFLAASLEEIVV